MATVLVNGQIRAKRGVYAAFRRWINDNHDGRHYWGARNQNGNRSRKYGDWLFHQDRGMFDEWLWRALQGRDCEGFDWKSWIE